MHNSATLVGWDIGGAHLKAARIDDGHLCAVVEKPCPLWQGMEHLARASNEVLATLPDGPVLHAVTMTGEMADLFPDRSSGVEQIVACFAERIAMRRQDTLRFYAGGQGFVGAEAGAQLADAIASANWLATAACCAASVGEGILIDIGSTTTDIIPFAGGQPCALGASDADRLGSGELVYAGMVRTPLMALASRAPLGGTWRGTMNEYFASSADIFRLLGELDESTDLYPAADNGPKSAEGSVRRLLRMIGEDLTPATRAGVITLARWYRERLLQRITDGLAQVISRGLVSMQAPLVGAGIGRSLVADLAARWQRPYRDCAELLCPENDDPTLRAWAGHCAPAVAVARLAAVTV
jgi:(4-(4-[2-(gamma-L-glutamylamino)ethyl]phenoxymethyl)furan-2-yl)methanamine synthase